MLIDPGHLQEERLGGRPHYRYVTNTTVYNRSIYKYNLIDVYKYNLINAL
jgi:hypothetical protein